MDEEKQNLENQDSGQENASPPSDIPQDNPEQNIGSKASDLEMPEMKFNDDDQGTLEVSTETKQESETDKDEEQQDQSYEHPATTKAEAEMLKMMEDKSENQDSETVYLDDSKPVVEKVAFEQLKDESETDPKNLDILLDVSLPLAIELGRTSMAIENILNLGPGSVVELDKLAGEPVDILVNDKLLAKGEVVVIDENFGVRITSMISPADRIRSLA